MAKSGEAKLSEPDNSIKALYIEIKKADHPAFKAQIEALYKYLPTW